MNLYIMSDLHIYDDKDPLLERLNQFLLERPAKGDTVVFAGDIFDLFVGNKKVFKDSFGSFINTVSELTTRGVFVHYIQGNHDFLLRDVFKNFDRFYLHDYSFNYEHSGKRFFFAHGDLADKSDYQYRMLRFFFRSWLMAFLVKILPGSAIEWIGRKSSAHSRARTVRLPEKLGQTELERLRKTYRTYAESKIRQGFHYAVMGHCHDLDEFDLPGDQFSGQYINVGFPRAHKKILHWQPAFQKVQRIDF